MMYVTTLYPGRVTPLTRWRVGLLNLYNTKARKRRSSGSHLKKIPTNGVGASGMYFLLIYIKLFTVYSHISQT